MTDTNDELAEFIDPPSPAADLLDTVVAAACTSMELPAHVRFGDIADTQPGGIGEAAVYARDDMVNAEFLIVCVPVTVATDVDDLSGMWNELVSKALAKKPATP